MSFFDEINRETTAPGNSAFAEGPRLGFLGAMEASYNAQALANSALGIQKAMTEEFDADYQKLRSRGVKAPVLPFGNSLNEARFFSPANQDTPGEYTADMQENDKFWSEAKQKYPDLNLRTPYERWQAVQKRAQEADRFWESSNTTFGGMIGGFIGGAAAGINPEVNPINFAALPLGGVGATAGARIASQAAGQGGVELVNQLTGVQEQRRLLGLDYGASQAFQQAAGAALAGGVFQGVGEGLGIAARRWFTAAPHDPAPPVPTQTPTPVQRGALGPDVYGPGRPVDLKNDLGEFLTAAKAEVYGPTRDGHKRTILDIENVTSQLDDWKGPAPWEVKPRTDTAPAPDVTTFTFGRPYSAAIRAGSDIEGAARAVDPEAFAKVDKLEAAMNDLRARMSEPMDVVDNEVNAQIASVEARLAEQQNGRPVVKGKARKRLERELEDLRTTAREAGGTAGTTRPADVAALDARNAPMREELMRLDAELRDTVPLVNRAMAQADNAWVSRPSINADTLAFLRRVEGRSIPFRTESHPLPFEWLAESKLQPIEPAPLAQIPVDNFLAARPDVNLKPGSDVADVMKAVAEADGKLVQPAVDSLGSLARSAVKVAEGGEKTDVFVLPNGREINMSERIFVDDAAGDVKEMSVREYLQDIADDHEVLGAVTTCGRIS